ncbi:MAG TPA: hypothetical protein ENL42_06005, partial [Thermoplasmatales archaeon]|nr:hypothetical protein [Thermoplasmatales archaeon]
MREENKILFGKKMIAIGTALLGTAFLVFILFSLYGSSQPYINNVTDSPDPVEIPGYNNITATINAGPYSPYGPYGPYAAYGAYGEGVNQVNVVIYYPNNTLWGNFSMTRISGTPTWYFNHTYDSSFPLGKYTYWIVAQDAYDWNKSGPYNFTLQDTTPPSSSLTIQGPYWDND